MDGVEVCISALIAFGGVEYLQNQNRQILSALPI